MRRDSGQIRRSNNLGPRKRVRALSGRPPGDERTLGVEAARGVLRREAPQRKTELVVGAPRDRVVALTSIEGPFDDAQPLHELGNDEVGIGIAVAMQVAALVDRHSTHRELDVLTFPCVEAPKKDLLRMALSPLVG